MLADIAAKCSMRGPHPKRKLSCRLGDGCRTKCRALRESPGAITVFTLRRKEKPKMLDESTQA